VCAPGSAQSAGELPHVGGVIVMYSKGNWMADPAKGRELWQ